MFWTEEKKIADGEKESFFNTICVDHDFSLFGGFQRSSFCFFSGNSESICQVFLSKYHTKMFNWTADLFAFVVKRGRL